MSQSSHLNQLQKIDNEIDHHTARVNEISENISNDTRITQSEDSVSSAQKVLHKAQNNLKNIEDDVRSTQVKIQTSESNLYSGRIRNPKELQDLQIEISSLKRRITALEDDQLAAMLSLEEAEKNYQSTIEDLQQVTTSIDSEFSILRGEKNTLIHKIERLQSERGAILSSISPENLEIYTKLYKSKRGIAISSINDSGCSACGAALRPSEIQNAHSPQQLAYCSYCGRILFAG